MYNRINSFPFLAVSLEMKNKTKGIPVRELNLCWVRGHYMM